MEGRTPLHLLCKRNDERLDSVKYFLKMQANINLKDYSYERNVLHFASEGNSPQIILFLLWNKVKTIFKLKFFI